MKNSFIKIAFLLYFLSAALLSAGQAQNVTHPQWYDYGQRQILFEDNFDDDRNGWINSFDGATVSNAKIHDGNLYIQNPDTLFAGSSIPLNIQQDKDFEIEFGYRIILSAHKKERPVNVCWGFDTTAGKKEVLSIATNGKFKLSHCMGGDHKNCEHDYGYARNLSKTDDQFIAVRIRRVGKKYFIFVNGKLYEKASFFNLDGNTLSLGAGSYATVAYSYLKVSYL